MVEHTFKYLKYLFTIVAFIFLYVSYLILSKLQTIYFGFLTLSLGFGMLMNILQMKRGEYNEVRLILSFISCVLFLIISLFIILG